MRKLASIQIIKDLQPIDGADNIVLATVLGWHVVVKKDEFKLGDKCVYFEIDSILPYQKEEAFAFLDKCKGRIKTQKLRGVYSQGLAMPLLAMPESFIKKYDTPTIGYDLLFALDVDTDLTEELGVTKYDPESQISGGTNKVKQHNFPEYVQKSDETRIQNIFSEFINLKEKMCVWLKEQHMYNENESEVEAKPKPYDYQKVGSVYTVTEKVDGTSCTISVARKPTKEKGFIERLKNFFGFKTFNYITKVCSRNLTVSNGMDPNDTSSYYTLINNKYKVVEQLVKYMENLPEFKWIALQGEILGPGIQGNKYKLNEHIWKVFNMQYETFASGGIAVRHVDWNKLSNICNLFGLKQVDRLYDVEQELLKCETIDDITNLSIGKSKLNTKQEREGIVVRYYPDNMSWKCISPKFLVKNDL